MRKMTKGVWNPKLNPDYAQMQLYVGIPHIQYLMGLLIDAPKSPMRTKMLLKLQKMSDKYQAYLQKFEPEATPPPARSPVNAALADSRFAKYAQG
jgi:hypothetical protein